MELSRSGATPAAVGSALGVPPRTIRDWVRGVLPHSAAPSVCARCLGKHDLEALPSEYVYLLGLYLGDGCLSRHARDVYKLRIVLDVAYPEIVSGALDATQAVAGKAGTYCRSDNCVEVFSYWRQWVCHFPQHAPGAKHQRPIVLAGWQQTLVERWPEHLIRGLIHSDGCRSLNTGRGGWVHPRYSFRNTSTDIHAILREACDLLDVRWTAAPQVTYVSRKADVARLDEFIGPKE